MSGAPAAVMLNFLNRLARVLDNSVCPICSERKVVAVLDFEPASHNGYCCNTQCFHCSSLSLSSHKHADKCRTGTLSSGQLCLHVISATGLLCCLVFCGDACCSFVCLLSNNRFFLYNSEYSQRYGVVPEIQNSK